MPRPGQERVMEKSKDFKGSMIRLIKNLNPWKYVMIIAITLAMFSSALALFAPNKLSEFADLISDGLVPKTEKLKEIGEEIGKNFAQIDFNKKIVELNTNVDLTKNEQQEINTVIKKLATVKDKSEAGKLMLELPDKVLIYLISDIEIDGSLITASDQVKVLRLAASIGDEVKTENALKLIDELPDSVYNLVKPEIDMDAVKKLAMFMAILYVTSALFSFIEGLSTTTVSNRFANSLRNRISKKINKLPLKYFDTHEAGDVLSRVTNDVDMIAQNLNNSLATIVAGGTLFIGSVIMMFITNWIMAITAIVSSLIGFALMFTILGKSQKYFNQKQVELGNMNGYIEEMYSGHNVVKAYNGTEEAINRFGELNQKLYTANRKSQFLSGMMHPIMGFVGNFGYVMVCIVGALLTMNNVITFGVIVAFMIYVRLFINPLTQIAQAMTSLQATAAASERVFEFLDEVEMSDQKDIKKKLNKSQVKGEIEFKNVKFGYDPGRTIIKDFSVSVKPGQKIAIVGPTGAGKTTMVNLLMKFYEINNGEILIDGVSTKDLTRENIHELFIMVLQDTWLFEGTIGDNIRFSKEDVSEREVWEALRTVGVDHFVKTLPGGLDYVLGDNDTVSQGQKQLLTIARGMIEDAPFLILDEATSNVDTRTEELVQKAMDKLTEGRTSFIIAHRLSTIKNADLILVMNEGNIIEQGTHDELLAKKGFYAGLYNSQFELGEE
ncbi:MAG: ABC transporter ATP-binding protein [Mycoplasmatota bacterium]|nr:ABC transporter ATP-binding protein [Mycoplasmatota bacterium]